MKNATTFWRRSHVSALASTLVFHRPDDINWARVALQFLLGLVLITNLLTPFAAKAQNLGNAPVFGQAVKGQQATTVEGTVLNIVNWGCNVIAPVVAVASRRAVCLDNCKTSHTLRILRLADESLRQGALNESRRRASSNIR